jgi:hypothetical protein
MAWKAINTSGVSKNMIADASGTRLALDATHCGSPFTRLSADSGVHLRVQQRWKEYGIHDHD